MPRNNRPLHSRLMLVLALSGTLLLGGCSLMDMFKGVDTHYQITGEGGDDDTKEYLDKILAERLTEKTEDFPEEPDLQQRQQAYIEETVKADLEEALHAKGYYEAQVTLKPSDAMLTGEYQVRYGPQYKIASLKASPARFTKQLETEDLKTGEVLDALKVLEAQANIYSAVQKDRCYFSLDVTNQVYLDRARNTADVEFVVTAGDEGEFGTVKFTGNDSVRESYLRKLLPFKEGECFRREKLESYKTRLLQSGLFSRADMVLPEGPAKDGSVDVTVDLKERAQRTLSAGATYYSDEGPGFLFGWQHRNLLGAAERLDVELSLSTLKQSIDLEFTKPYFMRNDQSLSLNSSVRRQDTDAYQELGIDFGGKINRNFTRHLTGSTGLNLTITRIEEEGADEAKNYGLVSLPQTLSFDNRDDKLDPMRGFTLALGLSPYFDAFGEADPFLKAQLSGTSYLKLNNSGSILLASKAGIGSIMGGANDNVPATERFYAGGGGSVRGYGYQEVGPKAANGDPSGGRSLVNFSVELRSKFTDKIGGVAFVDGATVSEEYTPQFNNFAIGAGVGVRYYTGFGPIRFDIAVPLTEKDDLDQNYQFYISIGQAF